MTVPDWLKPLLTTPPRPPAFASAPPLVPPLCADNLGGIVELQAAPLLRPYGQWAGSVYFTPGQARALAVQLWAAAKRAGDARPLDA